MTYLKQVSGSIKFFFVVPCCPCCLYNLFLVVFIFLFPLKIWRKGKKFVNLWSGKGIKKGKPDGLSSLGCGGSTRTSDLQVMSLASYQLLHSAMLNFEMRMQN